jgi:hypothetical protein
MDCGFDSIDLPTSSDSADTAALAESDSRVKADGLFACEHEADDDVYEVESMILPWLTIFNFTDRLPFTIGDDEVDFLVADGQERDKAAGVLRREYKICLVVDGSPHFCVHLGTRSDLNHRFHILPTWSVDYSADKNDVRFAIDIISSENRRCIVCAPGPFRFHSS